MFFNPLTFLIMILFFFFLVFFFAVVQINLLTLAFERIGIPPNYIFTALLASLIGSMVNIPLKKIPQKDMSTERTISFFGLSHIIPVSKSRVTTLAVNVGGAIIPVLISAYLLFKTGLFFRAFLATFLLTLVAHRLARPIRGVGIALPFFIAPFLAALLSLVIAYNQAPVIAYISGTLGTLIGADLLNLKKIQNLGAPVASIGGAGTFDGIFLSGILAVLLATILS
jgi:uncharacterized membrane protein